MPLLIYLTPWHKSLDLSVPAFQWLLTCLLLLFLWKRKAQYKGLATWAALCYLGACVISTVLALDPWSAVFGLFGTHRGGLLMTATLFLIFHLIRKDDEQPIQGSMILLGVWCAILCIYQKVGVAYFGMVPEFDGRAWGLFGSPVFSGPILAACIVAVGLPKPHQFGRQACFGLMLIGLALTATRGPWIALAIGMSALYLPKRYVMAFTLTGAVALACFIYRPEAGQKEVQRQLQTELAFKGIKKRPIQGIGGDQFAFLYLSMPTKFATKWRDTFTVHFQDHSHNSFIEVLSAQGIIGSVYALMLLVMILSALEGWKLGAFMSLLTYSLLNPLALPAKVLMVALASASIHGRGIQKVYVLSIVLMAAPLWHWFYEARLRSGTDGQKVNAALNLRIVERR